MEIKRILQSGRTDAMHLVWNVFLEFEAPDYVDEGINTFRDYINNENAINKLELYGAYKNEDIIGVIATRNEGKHIALLFVHGKYHKQGIGRKLFEVVLNNSTSKIITVNSSPYALDFYHKLGFIDTDMEQTIQGMRFTSMKYQK